MNKDDFESSFLVYYFVIAHRVVISNSSSGKNAARKHSKDLGWMLGYRLAMWSVFNMR